MKQRITSPPGGWTADFVTQVGQSIERLAVAKAADIEASKADSRGRESVTDLIRALRRPLRSALRTGCTRADLAAEISRALADAGIDAKAETIQRYLRGGRIGSGAKRTQERTRPAAPADAKAETGDEKSDETAALNASQTAQPADFKSAGADEQQHIDDAAPPSGADKMARVKEIARRAGVLRE